MANKYLNGSLGGDPLSDLTLSELITGKKKLDPAHQAARDYLTAHPGARPGFGSSMLNKVGQGVTMGWGDEIAAGAKALYDKARHPLTKSLGEYYGLEKAMQDELLKDATTKTGALGTAGEVVGGLGTALGAASKGLTLLRDGQGLATRLLAGGVEGAGYGALQGAGTAEGDKVAGASRGGFAGAVTGAGLPIAIAGLRGVASPIASHYTAWRDPAAYADRKIAQTIARSGRSEADILAEMRAAMGEPYALADALDYEGRRLLSTVTKAPGEGRQQSLAFLHDRQADQPERVVSYLREGFNSPVTAQRAETNLRADRKAEADINYPAARYGARPVNPSEPINAANKYLGETINPFTNNSTLPDDTVEAVVRRARGMLTNGKEVLTDFQAAFRAKRDIDAMIDRASPTQQIELIPIRNALDDALANASDKYAFARNRFRQQSKQIEAISTGKEAAGPALAEDAIPAFQAMPADQVGPFRAGFVDPLVSRVMNQAASGANRAKMSPNLRAKVEAFSVPSRAEDLLARLERENRMHSTLTEAAGGSKTVENAADQADMGIDPAIVSNILSGNFKGAGAAAARGVFNSITGNTEPVRAELAKRLLPLEGSEPLGRMLPRVTASFRDRARRNNRLELNAVRGLLDLGAQGFGRMQ